MSDATGTLHRATLTVSATEVHPGYTALISWKVVGIKANIASVHLTSRVDSSASMIERIVAEGSRELILADVGTFAFTLTATFGDGVRLNREARVHVIADN